MTFKHDQCIEVKVGCPLFTVCYTKTGKELHPIGTVMERESKGTAVNESGTDSTAWDDEHTHVRLDGNFWIVANENIKVVECDSELAT